MKYRKKPVVVEAVQWTGKNEDEIKEFCGVAALFQYIPMEGAAYVVTELKPQGEYVVSLSIRTLEGTMVASDGDFIIRGVEGEFYPCKPDIFRKTYEEVKDE